MQKKRGMQRRPGCVRGGGGSYLIIRVVEFVVELRHGLMNGTEGLDDIAENDWFPVESLAFAETLRVDELHLF